MLGVAVVCAEHGLDVSIHRSVQFEGDSVASNAVARAKDIYPYIASQIIDLVNQGKITIEIGNWDEQEIMKFITANIDQGKLGLAILDWDKWNPAVQKIYGNPRHVVTIYKVQSKNMLIMDPSISEEANPVSVSTNFFYKAMNEKQTLIFVGN